MNQLMIRSLATKTRKDYWRKHPMPQKGLRVLTYVTSWRWWTKSKANMQETSRWETAFDKTSISCIRMHKVDADPPLFPVCVPIKKITLSYYPFCLKLFFNRRPNSWRSSPSCGKTSPPLIAGSMRMLPKPTRRGSHIQRLLSWSRHSSYTKHYNVHIFIRCPRILLLLI